MMLLLGLAWAQDVIRVHGTLQHTGSGEAVVELLRQQDDGAPLLAWEGRIGTPGPFVLEVPAGLGEVRVRAALDTDEDGIGAADPQVLLPEPLTIGREDLYGIVLQLVRIDARGAPPASPEVDLPEEVPEGAEPPSAAPGLPGG